jgi:hypothetical protein
MVGKMAPRIPAPRAIKSLGNFLEFREDIAHFEKCRSPRSHASLFRSAGA